MKQFFIQKCLAFSILVLTTFSIIHAAPIASNFSTPEVCLGQTTVSSLSGLASGGTPPYTYQIITNPIQGTLTSFSGTTGAFTYTQSALFSNDTDTFTYKAIDATSTSSNNATVTINVGLMALASGGATPSVCSGATANGTLFGHQTGGTPPYTYSILVNPTNGTVTLLSGFTGNGNFSYHGNSTFTGVDQFTYQVTDALGCVNNPRTSSGSNAPIVKYNVGQAGPAITLSGNCPGNTVSGTVFGPVVGATNFVKLTDPSQGTLQLAPNFSTTGNFTYTSNFNFSGTTDSFTYDLTTSIGCLSTPGTVTITVGVGANSITTATICPGHTLVSSLFTAANGGALPYNYHKLTNPVQGTLTLDPNFLTNGQFSYTANLTFIGSFDSFTFNITDANACTSQTATVTIPVGLTIPSVTTASTCPGSTISGTVASAGTAPYTFTLVTPALYGELLFNTATGSFSYTPSLIYPVTSDSFSYSVTDTNGCISNIATITIPITIFTISDITIPGACTTSILDSNLATNLSSGNLAFTYSLVRGPSNGYLTLDTNFNLNGEFTYIPNPGFTGTSDSFTYRLNYINGCTSNIATVTIPIGIITTPSYTTQVICQNTSLSASLKGPISGGTPPFTYSIISAPTHGTLSLTASNGTYTYTPTPGFTGPFDSFTYEITDSIGCTTNINTVTIPVGLQYPNATIPATCPGATINGNLNAFVIRGEAPFSYVITSNVSHGILNLSGSTGAFTYIPTPGFTGASDSFNFQATDANGCQSNTPMVTILLQ